MNDFFVSDFPCGTAAKLILKGTRNSGGLDCEPLRILASRLIRATIIDFVGEPPAPRCGPDARPAVVCAVEILKAGKRLMSAGYRVEAKAIQGLLAEPYGLIGCEILSSLGQQEGPMSALAARALLQLMSLSQHYHERPARDSRTELERARRLTDLLSSAIDIAGGLQFETFRGALQDLWSLDPDHSAQTS